MSDCEQRVRELEHQLKMAKYLQVFHWWGLVGVREKIIANGDEQHAADIKAAILDWLHETGRLTEFELEA